MDFENTKNSRIPNSQPPFLSDSNLENSLNSNILKDLGIDFSAITEKLQNPKTGSILDMFTNSKPKDEMTSTSTPSISNPENPTPSSSLNLPLIGSSNSLLAELAANGLSPNSTSYATINQQSGGNQSINLNHANQQNGSTSNGGNLNQVSCRICGEFFNNYKDLQNHEKTKHANIPVYTCKVCKYCSLEKSLMIRHLRTHIGLRPFFCKLCGYAFTTKANCERHLRKRHNILDKPDLDANIRCDSSQMKKVPADSMHIGPDTVCMHCDQKFSDYWQLRDHMRLHDKKNYFCMMCAAAFSSRSNCVSHIMAKHDSVTREEANSLVKFEPPPPETPGSTKKITRSRNNLQVEFLPGSEHGEENIKHQVIPNLNKKPKTGKRKSNPGNGGPGNYKKMKNNGDAMNLMSGLDSDLLAQLINSVTPQNSKLENSSNLLGNSNSVPAENSTLASLKALLGNTNNFNNNSQANNHQNNLNNHSTSNNLTTSSTPIKETMGHTFNSVEDQNKNNFFINFLKNEDYQVKSEQISSHSPGQMLSSPTTAPPAQANLRILLRSL